MSFRSGSNSSVVRIISIVIFLVVALAVGFAAYRSNQQSGTFTTQSRASLDTRLAVKTGVVSAHPSRPNTFVLSSDGLSYVMQPASPEYQETGFSFLNGKTVTAYGKIVTTGEPSIGVQRVIILQGTGTPQPTRVPCVPDPARGIRCPQPLPY